MVYYDHHLFYPKQRKKICFIAQITLHQASIQKGRVSHLFGTPKRYSRFIDKANVTQTKQFSNAMNLNLGLYSNFTFP